jgi:hypothetical protein
MEENDLKFFLNVLIVVFLFFALSVFINLVGLNLNEKQPTKKLLQVVTIEGLTNPKPNTSIIVNKSDAFCENHRGSSDILEQSCGELTQDNCNSTSCCVWTSNNKCVAGKANGPTFNTNKNGKTKNLDYYYYQNKCYGPKCP